MVTNWKRNESVLVNTTNHVAIWKGSQQHEKHKGIKETQRKRKYWIYAGNSKNGSKGNVYWSTL